MRREPFSVGSYVHVIKRGARGFDIVRDDLDRWRFLLMLRHFNDEFQTDNWFRHLEYENISNTLNRPKDWPEQKKLVHILCFCLLNNHFHLLLQEIREGGISMFMQRLGIGMAKHFNTKYEESGSLFQGSYRSKTIQGDNYLRYVSAYIQVKNGLESIPGLNKTQDFSKIYERISNYPYCSLGNYAGIRESPIIDKSILGEIFSPKEYRIFAKEFLSGREINMDMGEVVFE